MTKRTEIAEYRELHRLLVIQSARERKALEEEIAQLKQDLNRKSDDLFKNDELMRNWSTIYCNEEKRKLRVKFRDDLVKFLKEEIGIKDGKIEQNPNRGTHGSCCTCSDCGYDHDDCVCSNNRVWDWIETHIGTTKGLNEEKQTF